MQNKMKQIRATLIEHANKIMSQEPGSGSGVFGTLEDALLAYTAAQHVDGLLALAEKSPDLGARAYVEALKILESGTESMTKKAPLIEKDDSRWLPIEKHRFTVSGREYNINVEPKRSLVELADRINLLKYTDRKDLERFNPSCRLSKDKKLRVRLVRVDEECRFGVASHYLKDRGFELADAWELMAFAQSAALMSITNHYKCRIFSLGTWGDTWLADSKQRERGYLCLHSQQSSWTVDIYRDDNHFGKIGGDNDCILVRVKT